MTKKIWAIVTILALVLLAGYIASRLWEVIGPHKPEVGPMRKQVADQVIAVIVEDLRNSQQTMKSAILLHLKNDPTDYITNGLRSAIERSGILDLRDRTVGDKTRDILKLQQPSCGVFESAIKKGKASKVQGVIFGTVHSFESYAAGAKVDLEIYLADVANNTTLFQKRYNKEISSGIFDIATIQEKVKATPAAARFIGWLAIVLLLPVFTISFIRTMVRKQSNKSNAFTLAIYTAVDALLVYLLIGASLTSWLSVLLFLVAVGLAFAYNVAVMSFALKLES